MYSESHAVMSTVRLLVTWDAPPDDEAGPTLMTSRFLNTVLTTGEPGLIPKMLVLTVASTVMRSPSWTYPPTPTCSEVGIVTATNPDGMGREVTSLLLRRSGNCA